MSIPKEIWGVCPVCAGKGSDYPAADLTLADSQTNIDAGTGLPLVYYKSKLMCGKCKEQKSAEDISLDNARKHSDTEKFLNNAGFINSAG